MPIKKRTSQLNIIFRDQAHNKALWDRAISALDPFIKTHESGRIQKDPVPNLSRTHDILKPLLNGTSFSSALVNGRALALVQPDELEDLTDVLRQSPLREDIPPNHMFMALSYALGDVFFNPPEKSLGTALHRVVEDVSWHRTIVFNHGGLWIHLLWHAYKGRTDRVQQLLPMCRLMARAPIIGRRKSNHEWLLLAV